ncbi:classical arabinogalactan protein 26-like [Rhododendron vialii]|uniref:classical arabinogalactan protein 26-like n=1 Tax=Rhododendron vialii TaxID=182163 RepID=UPI00265FCFC8|nr:classical arabinogalactan protein 26-like [Rhododendron vialii]
MICMASFWFLLPLTVAFMATSSLSLTSELNLETPSRASSISAAPAVLPGPPLSPPYTELSPDITPRLPSPGGELPSPTGSLIPTIPSNQSPPNPDEVAIVGPDSAISPSGSKLVSTASSLSVFGFLNLALLLGLMSNWR